MAVLSNATEPRRPRRPVDRSRDSYREELRVPSYPMLLSSSVAAFTAEPIADLPSPFEVRLERFPALPLSAAAGSALTANYPPTNDTSGPSPTDSRRRFLTSDSRLFRRSWELSAALRRYRSRNLARRFFPGEPVRRRNVDSRDLASAFAQGEPDSAMSAGAEFLDAVGAFEIPKEVAPCRD